MSFMLNTTWNLSMQCNILLKIFFRLCVNMSALFPFLPKNETYSFVRGSHLQNNHNKLYTSGYDYDYMIHTYNTHSYLMVNGSCLQNNHNKLHSSGYDYDYIVHTYNTHSYLMVNGSCLQNNHHDFHKLLRWLKDMNGSGRKVIIFIPSGGSQSVSQLTDGRCIIFFSKLKWCRGELLTHRLILRTYPPSNIPGCQEL